MINFWYKLEKPIIALAPMAGYTDSAFRMICKRYGADVVYSEMISVDAITYNNPKTLRMLNHDKKEYPLVIQLFGNNPKKFAEATKFLTKNLKGTIGIDINFGCPAHKVTKNGSGASLMDELDKAQAIIKAVCDNTNFPVSIKIRTKVKETTAKKFISSIKDLPWSTVMIHGRTMTQGFAGEIDYETINKIKELVPEKIVLANGGINNLSDAKNILDKTNADGIGIARGAWGNPWIFSEIKNDDSVEKNIKQAMLEHAKLFLKDNDNLIPLRKNMVQYLKGTKNASELRQKIIKVETLNDLKKILN
jgi:tRNA-dihydrouridine synthase B